MPSREVNPIAGAEPVASDVEAAEFERALEAAQNAAGSSSIEVAEILKKLGGAHRRAGRLAEAHRAYVQALEIVEESLGPDDVQLAAIYYSLADIELARGRFVTGEPYARRSLEICERGSGHDAEEVAMLAALLAGQGRSLESTLLSRSTGAVSESEGEPTDGNLSTAPAPEEDGA